MVFSKRDRAVPPVVSKAWRFISYHLPPLNFITLHYAYFIGVCMLSSIIFWGASTPPRSVSYTDSLFLVVSAMSLAGLNTINLSILNTFQQFMLFVLIILGSAILVSIVVVHTRRKAFERRFKSIVADERQKRREKGGSRRMSFTRAFSRSGVDVAGHDNGEEAAKLEKTSDDGAVEPANGHAINDISQDEPRLSPKVAEHLDPETHDVEAAHTVSTHSQDHRPLSIDASLTRRITFASPASPTRQRQHNRILSMQGVGARQNLMNHPRKAENPVYSSDMPSISETVLASPPLSSAKLSLEGFVGRNSQFSNLSLAERTRLGGVEYRAENVLALVVPLYFVLWQLFGCIGLGAYVAYNWADTATSNGLNPWWVGAFNGVSAFNNSGMSLLDANMTAFQTADYMLITMGLMILAGNTCYPVFLRLILWTMWKILPPNDTFNSYKVTIRFLLDHPRRCYTNLFPSRHTWWLLAAVICLNGTDWIAFEVLNIGNSTITSLPDGARALDGLFQALAVRSGGFYVVPIPNLRIGLLILYVIMMYISVYPVVITMRNSNVYEERSLGIYADDPQAPSMESGTDHSQQPGQAQNPGPDSFVGNLKRRLTSTSTSHAAPSARESRSYFVRQQLRSQLSHDLWWIVLAVLFITITETSQFERDPINYSVFNILFEVVSAYGCVGISVGLPNLAYSFSGGWHTLSKLILCAVMIRGRHRGLPVAIDRAVLLPGEYLAKAEEEDAFIRLERMRTSREVERGGG